MSETEGTVEQKPGVKKVLPSRGKRYSTAQKKEILAFAQSNSVESAAGKYGVTETSIYEWRRAAKRRGSESGEHQPVPIEEDSKEQRDRLILGMWRQLLTKLRIPVEADRDSAVMPTAVPVGSRPAFRHEADRDSGACRPV